MRSWNYEILFLGTVPCVWIMLRLVFRSQIWPNWSIHNIPPLCCLTGI